MIALRAGSATDVGLVRTNNQDSLLVAHPLYAVADGMGGAAAGEVASALAVEALGEHFPPQLDESPTSDRLLEAAQAANRAVWAKAEAHPEMRGMGTTLVALALIEDGQLAIINIGDSRLYAFDGDTLRQITSDHNLVAEMVAEGRLSKEEAEFHPRRNIMTRALGVEPDVDIDLFMERPTPGERFLLCSDGLPREVSDELIASVLRRFRDPGEAARELVEEAKRRGGNDNITVVVVDVVTTEEAAAATAAAAATGVVTAAALSDAAPAADASPATTGAPPAAASPGDAAPAPAKPRRAHRPTRSPITLRVIAFVLLLLLVVGAGVGGVIWYGRSSYFVTLRSNQIVIFQGRPGGVLWVQPTLAKATGIYTNHLLASDAASLTPGVEVASLPAAQGVVDRMVGNYNTAQLAGGNGSGTGPAAGTSPSTTAPASSRTTPNRTKTTQAGSATVPTRPPTSP